MGIQQPTSSSPPDLDGPSLQLTLETRSAIVKALATRRPILHHLNDDTSWLLQIPRPAAAVKYGGRIYYNILIDPWFVGGQSDVAKWFSQQWHAVESAVRSVGEVEELCRGVEVLAGGLRIGGGAGSRGSLRGRKRKVEVIEQEDVEEEDDGGEGQSMIDVVAISHEFTDHCHKETLLEVNRDVPVFATEVCFPYLHLPIPLHFPAYNVPIKFLSETDRCVIASRQTNLFLVSLPLRNTHTHVPLLLRLARLLPASPTQLAQRITPDRRARLSKLPLRPTHNLRHTPFPLHPSDAQKIPLLYSPRQHSPPPAPPQPSTPSSSKTN